MTDFSPEMQRSIDALAQRSAQNNQARQSAEKDRLDHNRNSIDRISRDARALGEIALRRGLAPSTTLSSEIYRPKSFLRSEQRSRTKIMDGWVLTWKHIIGQPTAPRREAVYIDGIKPSHYTMTTAGNTLGFVTMIGSDCMLYVVETRSLHSTTGSSPTKAMTGTYSDQSASALTLATPESSNLGSNNPQVLRPNASDYVVANIDVDLISQAMLTLAENKHLF